jgi:hypothetical protein
MSDKVEPGTPGLHPSACSFESYDDLAHCKFTPRWTLTAEATNLTAVPEQAYFGTSRCNLDYGDTGRSCSVGVTLTV